LPVAQPLRDRALSIIDVSMKIRPAIAR